MSLSSEVISRLQAIDPPPFRIVAGAAAFAAIDGAPKALPAAYVLIETETSGENMRATGPVLQQTQADIAVVIYTRNVADNTGAAAAADIEDTLKPAVRAALVGWVPDLEGADPVTHVESTLLKTRSGVVCVRELFGASYYTSEV